MSHNSPRSLRTKENARTRPDIMHNNQAVRIQPGESQSVLNGGTELSQLIKESDAHLVAMRKIVQ